LKVVLKVVSLPQGGVTPPCGLWRGDCPRGCQPARVHQQSRPDAATRHRGAGMPVARSSCL